MLCNCHHGRRQATGTYHFISQLRKTRPKSSCFLRSLSFFRCRRVRHVGSHSSQTDRPKYSTLQGQSLGLYSKRMTSYGSPTIFNRKEVILATFGLSRIPLNNICVSRLFEIRTFGDLALRSIALFENPVWISFFFNYFTFLHNSFTILSTTSTQIEICFILYRILWYQWASKLEKFSFLTESQIYYFSD